MAHSEQKMPDKEQSVIEIEEKIIPTEKNRLIVRIWMPQAAPAHLPKAQVGHVSLELNGQYFSIWPYTYWECSPAKKLKKEAAFFQIAQRALPATYKNDLEMEGGRAPATYCFYSLNLKKLEEEINRIIVDINANENESNGWMFSRNHFIVDKLSPYSCASLVQKLLAEANFAALFKRIDINTRINYNKKSFSNKHTIEAFLYNVGFAKSEELELHKETVHFLFKDENPAQLDFRTYRHYDDEGNYMENSAGWNKDEEDAIENHSTFSYSPPPRSCNIL